MESLPQYLPITDWMLDTETQGLRPDRDALIQVCLLPFNAEHRVMWPELACNVCIEPLPGREMMDPKTGEWWAKHADVLERIRYAAHPPRTAFEHIIAYIVHYGQQTRRVWGNRPFDWQFLESHFADLKLVNPFSYWQFRELATACEVFYGNGFDAKAGGPRPLRQKGRAHDALYDCIDQCTWLFNSMNRSKQDGYVFDYADPK